MIALETIFLSVSLSSELWAALKIQEKFFKHRGKKLLTLCLALAFFIFSNRLGRFFNNYLVFAAAWLVLFLFLFSTFYRGEPWSKLSIACLIFAMMDFTRTIFTALFSILNLLLLHRKSELFWMNSDTFVSCLSSLFTAVTVWICFKKMGLKVTLLTERYGKIIFAAIYSLIFLTDIINFGISRGVSFVSDVNQHGNWNPYLNELLTHVECIILSVLSITIVLCLTVGINKIMQYALSEQIHHAKVKHYQALLEEYGQQTRLRHDMKNHMIGISALIEKKDYVQLEKYIDRIYKDGHLIEQEIQTGNTIIDAILNIKQQTAAKSKISFVCHMHLTRPIEMEDFDLCILLGNLLDNAIQAEEKIEETARHICVRAEIVKRNLIIEIRNTYYAPEPTTRFHSKNYGTGLWNVKHIVEQNGGIMELSVSTTEFCASVMLPVVNTDRI